MSVAQLDRALDSDSKGRRFDSCRAHQLSGSDVFIHQSFYFILTYQEVIVMSYIPTPQQALELVSRYNQQPFHLQHAQIVGKVLGTIAAEVDPGKEDYWTTVGILHDIDFEQWPDQHCVKADSLLRELDIDEGVIHAVVSHGYGLCADVEPVLLMEKYLFAVDELTGLIGAAALMRPTGLDGMEVKSVMKKFKDKKFAAGCSREVISRGAEMLGLTVQELIAKTLPAMAQ